jgi:hypothetical protein
MFWRILLASATIVALAAPVAQAGSLPKCHFAFATQCAANVTHGSSNKARIDQNMWGFGFQLGVQFQRGDGNDAYTGQTGNNQVALTVQKGNDNTAYTSQDGVNQGAVTVQTGNGLWGASTNGGDNTVTYVIQSN